MSLARNALTKEELLNFLLNRATEMEISRNIADQNFATLNEEWNRLIRRTLLPDDFRIKIFNAIRLLYCCSPEYDARRILLHI